MTTSTGPQAAPAAAPRTTTSKEHPMPAATAHRFAINALVTVDDPRFPGIVYKVVKQPAGARGVNYTLSNVTRPTSPGYRGPEEQLTAFDGTEDDARNPAKRAAAAVAVVDAIPLAPARGTVVTATNRKIDPRLMFVVTGDRGDAITMVQLGGGPEWGKVPTKSITPVDLNAIAALMPGHLAAAAAARV